MSKYKKYQKYKSLSFPFLDEIPSSWMVVPLYALSDFRQGKLHEPYIDEDGKFICINSRFVSTEGKKFKHCNVNLSPVKKSDILMVMSDLPNGRALAKALFVEGENNYALNQRVCAITPTKVYPRFLYYQLNRNAYFLSFDDGSNQTNLSNYDFKKYPVLLPSTQEQQTIANYLDKATVKIDTLIEKQTKLIELLKEKRQAVISTAVTRGLNSSVPMKDSGVEWLGEIPEHWEVKPAQFIAKITRGAILRPVDAPEYFEDDGEWAYLNISDATKCDKYLSDSKLKLSQLGSTKSARVYPDNVIITASATIGKAFINKIKVCVHDGFIPFTEIKVYKDYLYHYLSNPFLYAAMGKSNTQKNIYLDEVKRMIVTVPPRKEQIEIVTYLEYKSLQMNNLINKATKAVELLIERRTALISAVVTGKIDIRDENGEAT